MLWFAFLFVPGGIAADPDALRKLWDSRQWFALREAVEHQIDAPPFFRAAVACAFSEIKSCERQCERLISSETPSEFLPVAHNFLVNLYVREGRFRTALRHREAVLAIQKRDPERDSLRSLIAAYAGSPDLSVMSRKATTIQGEFRGRLLFLPLTVNGVYGKYIIDTGANFSTITESEAKRLGLEVKWLSVDPQQIKDSSGKGVKRPRFAVAREFSMGGIRLRNVPFLVVSDEAPGFSWLPLGYRGAVGIQVLLACRTVSWDSGGNVRLALQQDREREVRPNLCFNGLDLVSQVEFKTGTLDLQVDTGADGSSLYIGFVEKYPDIFATAKDGTKYLGGAGGEAESPAKILPQVELGVGGLAGTVRPAYILPKDVDFDGVVGMDLLGEGRSLLFDFQSMKLVVRSASDSTHHEARR
jgi:hypothetical protein